MASGSAHLHAHAGAARVRLVRALTRQGSRPWPPPPACLDLLEASVASRPLLSSKSSSIVSYSFTLPPLDGESPDGVVPVTLLRAAASPPQKASQKVSEVNHDGAGARDATSLLPMVIYLHATGSDTDEVLSFMAQRYAARGYLAVGVDARRHGRRNRKGESTREKYGNALLEAWEKRDDPTHRDAPFLLDSAYDVCRVVSCFHGSTDNAQAWGVDTTKIGITGISLGGMIGLLCSAADERIAASAPMIGTQSFAYGLDNDMWQARVNSLPGSVFADAQRELGGKGSALTPETVRRVYSAISPGLLDDCDGETTVPLASTRPLAIINAADDPRNPLDGVRLCVEAARSLPGYDADTFLACAQLGTPHTCTDAMQDVAMRFLDVHLKGDCDGAKESPKRILDVPTTFVTL